MLHRISFVVAVLAVVCTIAAAQTEAPSGAQLKEGPCLAYLGDMAELQVPAGFVFADAEQTRALMEAMQNPPTGAELGMVCSQNEDWFVVFEFDDVGYIRDDEKDSLDANAILAALQKGNEHANAERRSKGWPEMTIVGWEQQPRYDETTHNLEWAIRGSSADAEGETVNYNTRLLGRSGVMSATLVTGPEDLAVTLPQFKSLLGGFSYLSGHQYAEYRQGDKLAKYGLSALVVGGATAVAVKTGLAKWVWKAIVVGAIAIGGFMKRIFKRD